MTDARMLELMVRFRTAYSKADRDGLLRVVTADFAWHQHCAPNADQLPTGRILNGVDELLTEVLWRREHWRDVNYANLKERAAGDILVQTFVISGRQDDIEFHANAVDLYPVRDGKIARKDTYWKYTSGAH